MNRLYIIFPHCYIKATSKELLIYDTIKFSSIYMRNIVVYNPQNEMFAERKTK